MAKVEEGAKGNCNECGEVKPLPNYPNDSVCAECSGFNKAWGVVKRFDWSGRTCKGCGHNLSDDDFDSPGSWSYTCPECDTRYNHDEDDPYEDQAWRD